MKRAILYVCLALVLFAVAGGTAETNTAQDLAVRIVPTRYTEKGGRAITLYRPPQHFNVVVTNVSGKPLKLWREWCSWGYFALSFAVTDEDGKPVLVQKKGRGWDKNYADATIVPPGDHMVFEVTFDNAIWQNSPLPETGRSRTVKLKAEYDVAPDSKSKRDGVWTGRVSSSEETFTIWR